MLRKILVSITVKFALATLLVGSSVVASAGTIRCLFGMPMACTTLEKPVPKAPVEDCCHPKKVAPKKVNKCCCIEALKKSPTENATASSLEFRLDFPIFLAAPIRFAFAKPIFVVSQIRWPEVHGPPGDVPLSESPRAPPVI